jgi:hypothetical protein
MPALYEGVSMTNRHHITTPSRYRGAAGIVVDL